MGRLRNGVYEQVAADVARGKYRWGDRACPICEIGDFSKEPVDVGVQERHANRDALLCRLEACAEACGEGWTSDDRRALELEREVCLADNTEYRAEATMLAALESDKVVASAVPVFRSPLEGPSRTECELGKRPLATHSAALAELASSGEVVFGGCSGCGLLPESFHTSTALVRARETVERFAERLTRERNFSTSSFRMFVQELRAAWH